MAEKQKEGAETALTQPTEGNALSVIKKGVVDIVAGMIKGLVDSSQLHLPKGYSAENAMKEAWLILQDVKAGDNKKALEVCDKNSIANALLSMVVQGLNVGKKQGYFIPYGKTLTFQRSYLGAEAVAMRVDPKIAEFAHAVVYEDDKFKYGILNGKKAVTTHEQDIDNVDKTKIKAAYCIALDKNGDPMKTEIMTMADIKQSWKQSKLEPVDSQGNIKATSTHGKFTEAMALRTVINKLCKPIINSSDDSALLESINRNDDLADEAAARAEIEDNANMGEVVEIPGPEAPEEAPDGELEEEVPGDENTLESGDVPPAEGSGEPETQKLGPNF